MEFSNEEISLCKQVAEKWKKEINKEDYAYDEEDQEKVLIDDCTAWIEEKKTELYRLKDDGTDFGYKVKHWFPLWTISDCLEFLEEKELDVFMELDNNKKEWWIGLAYRGSMPYRCFEGEALLEICLKAVLAVLEEV